VKIDDNCGRWLFVLVLVLCGCRYNAICTIDAMGADDGDVGKSSKMLEVWRVAVLLGPQQKKFGHHGRV
jgi:hypothetical protein